MKSKDKLYSELSPLERARLNYSKKSMLFKLYSYLNKKRNKKNVQ